MKFTQITKFDSCLSKEAHASVLNDVVVWANAPSHMYAIKQIEEAAANGDQKRVADLKRRLPAIAFCGVFKDGHAMKNLVKGNGLLVLDFDKLTLEQVAAALIVLRGQESVVMAAPSPTGRGLKVIVRTDHIPGRHKEVFALVSQYFEDLLGLKVDQSGKDISRLCFLFSGEHLYFNPNAKPLVFAQVSTEADIVPPCKTLHPTSTTSVVDVKGEIPSHITRRLGVVNAEQNDIFIKGQWQRCEAVSMELEAKACFKEGDRNTFVFKYGCKTCLYGIPRSIAQAWAEERYVSSTFPVSEVISAIASGYSTNETLTGRDAHKLQVAMQPKGGLPSEEEPSGIELYELTPYLPDEIFDKLPPFFQKAVMPHNNKRERDIILLSTLVVTSCCLPGITGLYGGVEHSAHLYFFVVAKAASGKGKAGHPFGLAHHYVNYIKTEADRKVAQYVQDKADFDAYCAQMKEKRQPVDMSREPVEEYSKLLWIPANTSRSRFITLLTNNGQLGSFVLETEADALSVNKNTDWGDLSLVLRPAFQHERISLSRTGDGRKEVDEVIENPHVGIFLTGTPDQFVRLMGSADNGLYSRFGTYAYHLRTGWDSQAPSDVVVNYKKYYNQLSETLLQYALFSREHPSNFNFTKSQWERFDAVMAPLLDKALDYGFENESSVVKRLGLIFYRIAMILSAVRRAERTIGSEDFYCSEDDFNAAMAISQVCLEHSKLLLSGFKSEDKFSPRLTKSINGPKDVLAKLPDVFGVKDVTEFFKSKGKSSSTGRRFLDDALSKGLVVKLSYGVYQKVGTSSQSKAQRA